MKIDSTIGIDLIRRVLAYDIERSIYNLNHQEGSYSGSLANLIRYSEAKTLAAWFIDQDLNALKQNAFVTAKLRRMKMALNPGLWEGGFVHFYALISDHHEIVHWYSQLISPYMHQTNSKRRARNRVGAPEYHAFQAILALQGKFDLLGERAEYILANPPGKQMTKYQIDQEFYLALAKGDKTQMENILTELTGPKAKVRNFDGACSLTQHLMSMFGFIYAKMAWRHGYELDIDTPYLPQAWLPIKPLDNYSDEYGFVADYDLFTPFEGEQSNYSPVAPGQTLYDIEVDSKPEPGK